MIYQIYQAQQDVIEPFRRASGFGRRWLTRLPSALQGTLPIRHLDAAWGMMAGSGLTHVRPGFGISDVEFEGRKVAVEEQSVLDTPFCTLLRFRKPTEERPQPRVLIVSPMACHFATLLRDTIRALLPAHDVYVTDWKNVRDVSLSDGGFDLDDYIEHLMRFLHHLGPGVHLMAICQPCPAALAAVALMSEDGHPATPATLTLMAGPIDTSMNPTQVNRTAHQHSLAWFERTVIARVPTRYEGAGRRVYPGFLQIAGFMSMNLSRHRDSFRKLYRARVANDLAVAEPIEAFYDEYFAVCDLPAEFYLQTMSRIFQERHLPEGRFLFRGRLVNPAAICRTALMTVEGGRDDICGAGQTRAAQDLCSGLRPDQRLEHVEAEAGHYGVFGGRRWTDSIFPKVREWIERHH